MQQQIYRVFLLALAFLGPTRFDCTNRLPWQQADLPQQRQAVPPIEIALRAVDLILFEPGYRQARALASTWKTYADGFLKDEKRAADLEALANSPAVLGFLRDPESRLAASFSAESTRLMNEYGNGAFKAWRLRTLTGKVVLQNKGDELRALDISETRREINSHFITVPIANTGFNYSLDAEWDISRLPDFPLTQINSEFLYVQTDVDKKLIGIPEGTQLPDSAFRFVSGGAFIAPGHGLHEGYRIIATESGDLKLFLCYPFAGYWFYAVRGSILILMFSAFVYGLVKLGSAREAARHVLENRSGRWLEQHYSESLSISERAIDLNDQASGLVTQIKERDAAVIAELGGHIQHLTRTIRTESERGAITAGAPTTSQSSSVKSESGFLRPMHKKAVYREPIIIENEVKSGVEVEIDLDLPLKDEKELTRDQKTAYVTSLRRRAQDKSGAKEFIHDESIDNFDYVAPDPMPMPSIAMKEIKGTPDAADLEYVQKFRYAGKARVLPMAEDKRKSAALHMHEDLHVKNLVIIEDE